VARGLLTNDNTTLVPRSSLDGPTLVIGFPAFHVGVAEYAEGPTGCTVFYFPEGATAAVDIRGGECGTIQTQHLAAGDHRVDAICFSGGSEYGFGAVVGVADELLAMRGYSTEPWDLVQVPGAVIYDFPLRDNVICPDGALGRAALRTARPDWFPLGARGAGCSAAVGVGFSFDQREQSGQGGAFRQVGPVKIAVFTVVNAVGAIVNRRGEVVRGHLDRKTGVHHHAIEDLERRLSDHDFSGEQMGRHTTLTLLVTNQKLVPRSLRQLGKQVHTSMARVIQPFHTIYDGDVFFTVTTGEVEDPELSEIALGVLASELAWDAVLSCLTDNEPQEEIRVS
jgi:L-aminopeptidase/D-esterase-like protein